MAVLLKFLQPNIGDNSMTWRWNIHWHTTCSFRPTKLFYNENLESSPLAKKWNFVLTWYNEQAYYNQKVTQISLCMSSLQKWPPYLTMTNENKNFKLGHFGVTVQPSDWPWWNLPITTTWSEKIIQIIFFLLMKLWTHTLLANFSTVINCNYSQRA